MQWYHWTLIVAGLVFVAVVFIVNRRAAASRRTPDDTKKDIYPMW
jgi:hypothetical protein